MADFKAPHIGDFKAPQIGDFKIPMADVKTP